MTMNMNPINERSISVPALFLAAPASGQGKTTITAALARYFTNQGKVVRVFKTGPDYLDPQILAQASGQPVVQLDLWMAGEAWCQQQLFAAAQVADLILVEGAMGMFDGDPSSADLAARFNIPIAMVMDVKGMAQTAAAIATGLARYRDDYQTLGLIANNCSTARHAELIQQALPDDVPLLACLANEPTVALPERHLGLVQAQEVYEQLEPIFELGCQWLVDGAARAKQSGAVADLFSLAHQVAFYPVADAELAVIEQVPKTLDQVRIGIARDAAFSFIYDANLALLEQMGAQLAFFSPLNDTCLPPEVDALWLPGGYPELHTQALSSNQLMHQAIKGFYHANKPILAECGGFLYCLESLTDLDEQIWPMLGLLAGQGLMRGKRGCQGMQTASLPEGDIRGHAHHRSRSQGTDTPLAYCQRQRHSADGEAIYRSKKLTASYLHLFFPANPTAVAALFLGAFNEPIKLGLG
ncbi:cobyrinate a,c-diamide synthase [Motilimonas sp. E26]|uniref:cobyrinate a,c-diamide synthase n=1 Tax=Motilimonas sp. E26 TaxID=2865674 RepID=UPI001E5CE02F|nr:cobyrinate a,c-diamide synthase [Motilimonas sp. E26]